MASLLPPNATQLERDIEQTTARLSAVPTPAYSPFDIDAAPASLLPWIAWALSVDYWNPAWPESTKRAVLTAAVATHRIKGTPASISAVIEAAGYTVETITEGSADYYLDGSWTLDGSVYLEDTSHWADFSVRLGQAISNEQATEVINIISTTQPARCRFLGLDYQEAVALLDGTWVLDGAFNLGVAA